MRLMDPGQLIQNLANHHSEDQESAQLLARAAFLDWVFSLPADTDVQQAAQDALLAVARSEGTSTSLALFKSQLEEARQPLPAAVRRGGPRRRHSPIH